MVVFVINHAELSWRHTLDEVFSVYDERAIACAFKCRTVVFGRMSYLKPHVHTVLSLPRIERKEMEIVYWEILFVGGARLETLAYKQYVALHVFLHRIPRSAAEAKSVTLTDGMEPKTLMLTNLLAGLQFEHIARIFAEIATYVVVVVYHTEEADALLVLALGID